LNISVIPSVVTWWHTLEDRQVAIIGTKVGLLIPITTKSSTKF